ncbi:2-oxoglutarate dehydrogenase complex dihydrolipoyllysine-residue succinyltransferase [Ancylomarina sp. 16SWW S1-10-2]|uniref:2-oxoglutarate dehydrogenase complex dihydrolipoyllysine-residue succinyltransferase n=1 Tax=Ancylomarina sp. 16SWW S1-10-2 TaxID=2499681 RepID=UPI0012AE60A4|nr:2-oxoglutarate dehydrogenase complex dihydrolipoyllysine-residue succinyltransferase [Ancylomarina sp. 16SWW S1-10-2]MRT93291.1 2-oxoglutarate dehydrogenase complex dihydrolipoyllysine-residue succinyltransferase [Ancylomarina sp. 16SWW S1-10-2]
MLEIKIPSPGESISEVEIANWFVADGDLVEKDQEIAEIESDKATLTLIADEGGKISIKANEGDTVPVGSVACTIDTSFAGEAKPDSPKIETPKEEKESPKQEAKAPETAPIKTSDEFKDVKISPVAKKLMEENQLSVDDVIAGLHRLSKKDIEQVVENKGQAPATLAQAEPVERQIDRKKMSNLRKKLSARLVSVKNETAMLTTFNELDMTAVMQLRKKYQKQFVETHDIKLGFMSFFTKAVSIALKAHPAVNSMMDGDEIITPNYMDVAIAVQTPKGLMVPVIRDTQNLGLADIEKELMRLANKARTGKISLDEMTGGTFTITNGGVFGSLLSTPIINPPQSGILGMHNIVQRPIAVNGKVEIRPMMYIALSYDHRVIDGKDSVGFLVKIKELIENPHRMITMGQDPDSLLLEI